MLGETRNALVLKRVDGFLEERAVVVTATGTDGIQPLYPPSNERVLLLDHRERMQFLEFLLRHKFPLLSGEGSAWKHEIQEGLKHRESSIHARDALMKLCGRSLSRHLRLKTSQKKLRRPLLPPVRIGTLQQPSKG